MTPRETVISDLSIAQPSSGISATPRQDHWLLLPYEGKSISGQMLWSPARNNPPDLTIPLPKLGLCRIHVGIFASGTWPWYWNLSGVYGQRSTWNRLLLRLSDVDFFDEMVPNNHPEEERLGYVTETYWKTARLDGQSLVISPPRKEGYRETMTILAHLRLVPVEQGEAWPKSTKRLVQYFDSNYYGHYVDSVADVKSHLVPLRDSDIGTVFWTTCREDSCYYPSKVGNPLPAETQAAVYPYWQGSDLAKMLARGEDPLKAVCDIGHECGLEVFSSYRRMTCRMPPYVFPLHPDAMFMKRRDLWCADAAGKPIPHLSMAYPDVRRRMIDLQVEQASHYDIDGVHFYFSRSVPFVYYEKPFLQAFEKAHPGVDPRLLPQTDERVSRVRAGLFIQFLRELRQALDQVGKKRGRRVQVAMHVQNTVGHCLYYGIDVAQIAREGLLDIVLPDGGHFLPSDLGSKAVTPEAVADFLAATRGTTIKVVPVLQPQGKDDRTGFPDLAAAMYAAGAPALHPGHASPYNAQWQIHRRLGHVDELSSLASRQDEWERIVRFQTMAGMTFDLESGITTCG